MIPALLYTLFALLAVSAVLRAMRRMSTETRRVGYLDKLLNAPVVALRSGR